MVTLVRVGTGFTRALRRIEKFSWNEANCVLTDFAPNLLELRQSRD